MTRIGMMVGVALGTVVAVAGAQTGSLVVNDVRINYVAAGQGPAVVLVHGWALNLREWTDQIAALSTTYRVIAPDRRGFGRSTGRPDASVDPGDLRALLDHLGVDRAVLVGHSAGSDVVMRFAAAFPGRVRALVFYGGGIPIGMPGVARAGGPGRARGRGEGRAGVARQYGIDSVMRQVSGQSQFRPGPNRTPAMEARLDSIIREYRGADLLEDYQFAGTYPPVQLDSFRSWTFPTLYVSGETEAADWFLATDSLVRWMPMARRVVIPGGGHGVHFDEPAAFNRVLLEFLRQVNRPAR